MRKSEKTSKATEDRKLYTRRDFTRWGAIAGAYLTLPAPVFEFIKSGKSTVNAALTQHNWLNVVDPIQPVTGPANGFLGDEPGNAHNYLWNPIGILPSSKVSETTKVVIVGGGISGLAAAYLLRSAKPIIVEQASTFGGNAKGERWGGIDYSLGGAYFGKLGLDDPIMIKFYKPLGIDRLWRTSSDDPVELKNRLYKHFWGGHTDPRASAAFKKAADYFRDVLLNRYPDIPPKPNSALKPEELAALDRKGFLEVVADAIGNIHPHIKCLLEYYCWSSFGGCASEISAASGLNFFASEFGGVCVLPGGNAKLASQILKALAPVLPKENFRTRTLVTNVTSEGESVYVQCVLPDGSARLISANVLIMACPKFVAARIMPSLPALQREAINALIYRPYLVANVLLDAPIPRSFFDLYLLADGIPPDKCQAALRTHKVTDVVIGHFARAGKQSRSILTLYHPLPYEEAKTTLLHTDAYGQHVEEFRKLLPDILRMFNVSTKAVREIRLARWGHPLPLAAKGLLASGTLVRASQPVENRIFFCNQDNWALPSIETCLSVALDVAPQVREVLG